MKKPDRVEELLDRLAVLRRQPDQPGVTEELRIAPASKVSLAVAKAAKIAGDARARGNPASWGCRLKVWRGDQVQEVLGEGFAAFWRAEREQPLQFVARYLDDRDPAVAEAAILALGESRQAKAFEILREKLERTAGGPLRQTLLMSIASQRLEPAIDYLLAMLETGTSQAASEAVVALAAIYRSDERIRKAVEAVVVKRGDGALMKVFHNQF